MIKLAWVLIKLGWRVLRLAFTVRKVLRATRVRRGPAGRCKWDPDFARREDARVAMLTGSGAQAVHGSAGMAGAGTLKDYSPEPVEGGLPWGQYLTCGPGRVPLGVQPGETAHPELAHLVVIGEEDMWGRRGELPPMGDLLASFRRIMGHRGVNAHRDGEVPPAGEVQDPGQ